MKKVLIIDDNQDVRLVVKTALIHFGFSAYEASDGRQGIQMALEHMPDVILCDVNMRPMDGFKTLEAFRNLPQFVTTPIILMTGSVDHEGFRRGMTCGADDFLQKPFQHDELVEVVVSRLVRHEEMQAQVEKRAEALRDAVVQKISRELSGPLHGLIGVVSAMRRESPSFDAEQAFANACSISDSLSRLGQMSMT